MPRGVKGSGKSNRSVGDPGMIRKRKRCPRPDMDVSGPEVIREAAPDSRAVEVAAGANEPAPGADEGPPGENEQPAQDPADAPPDRRKRGRRKAGKPAAPAPESQTTPAEEQDPALREAERKLAEKYPAVTIKPGSLRPAGGRPEFANKRSVIILCAGCKAERVLATSDLFHVSRCVDCVKAGKRVRRATRDDEPADPAATRGPLYRVLIGGTEHEADRDRLVVLLENEGDLVLLPDVRVWEQNPGEYYVCRGDDQDAGPFTTAAAALKAALRTPRTGS